MNAFERLHDKLDKVIALLGGDRNIVVRFPRIEQWETAAAALDARYARDAVERAELDLVANFIRNEIATLRGERKLGDARAQASKVEGASPSPEDFVIPQLELSDEARSAVEKCYQILSAHSNGDWQLVYVAIPNRLDEKAEPMLFPLFVKTRDGQFVEATFDPAVWNSLPAQTQCRVFPEPSPPSGLQSPSESHGAQQCDSGRSASDRDCELAPAHPEAESQTSSAVEPRDPGG